LAADAVAALSVWALLVPQGLAYAIIAGVPVQYGLYTAFVGLIAYAVFGTSRQLVQGPSGAVAIFSPRPLSTLCLANLPTRSPTAPPTTTDASNGGDNKPITSPTPAPTFIPLRPR
jgi:Sulfate permease family